MHASTRAKAVVVSAVASPSCASLFCVSACCTAISTAAAAASASVSGFPNGSFRFLETFVPPACL